MLVIYNTISSAVFLLSFLSQDSVMHKESGIPRARIIVILYSISNWLVSVGCISEITISIIATAVEQSMVMGNL
mgnify:FL=1